MVKVVKIIYFILCFSFVTTNIFCEDWEFIVLQDSPIYTTYGSNEPVGFLHKDKIIISNGNAGYGLKKGYSELMPYFGFEPDNEYPYIKRYHVTIGDDIVPANTVDLFNYSIIGKKNNILMSYCCDILRSKDRETLFKYEAYYKDNQSYFEDAYMKDIYWYEEYDSNWSRFFVFNSILSFGYRRGLIVNNIEKTEYGYKVICKESTSNNSPDFKVPTLEWNNIKGKKEFTLFIYIDSDYIDLYVDNTTNKVGTFVFVSNEFVNQFNNLIKTNTCDLANVQWPRRANGNMDYPSDQQAIEKTVFFTSDTEDQESEIFQNNLETSLFPTWTWITIIGVSIVVVGGGMAFFIIRRKMR